MADEVVPRACPGSTALPVLWSCESIALKRVALTPLVPTP